MNRPIKFRAWNKEWEMMLPVDSLSFDKDGAVSVEVTVKASDYDHEKEWGDYVIGDDVFLMQSTGLLDKNGKEIYEGDVVKDGVIEFKYGKWLIVNKNDDLKSKILYDAIHDTDEQEVIGNVYEHPDLLPHE